MILLLMTKDECLTPQVSAKEPIWFNPAELFYGVLVDANQLYITNYLQKYYSYSLEI